MSEKKQEKDTTKKTLNVIDAVVLLLVIVCFISTVVRASKVATFGTNTSNKEECRIYFSVRDISATSAEYFAANDTAIIADSGIRLGKLEMITDIKPTEIYVKNDRNEIVAKEYPPDTRVDVSGTLISEGYMEDEGFKLNEELYLATGDSFLVYTEHISFILTVLDIVQK